MLSPCLFIDVDTQNDFFDPNGGMPIKGASEIRDNLKKLTKNAQKKGIKILSSLERQKDGSLKQKKVHPYGMRGTNGYKKISETLIRNRITLETSGKMPNYAAILKKYDQIIFEKYNFDLFTGNHILQLLRKSKIKNCIVYGVAIDYGLEKAALWLIKNGFKVWIPVDAVKPINEDNREPVMKELRSKGAEMWNTDFIIQNT
jgi:nicotinamidase-related amidase